MESTFLDIAAGSNGRDSCTGLGTLDWSASRH